MLLRYQYLLENLFITVLSRFKNLYLSKVCMEYQSSGQYHGISRIPSSLSLYLGGRSCSLYLGSFHISEVSFLASLWSHGKFYRCFCVCITDSSLQKLYFWCSIYSFAKLQIAFHNDVFVMVLTCIAVSASAFFTASHTSPKKIIEDGLEIFRVNILVTSSSPTCKSTSKLIENILVFEARIGIIFCWPGLVVHPPFALVREDLVSTIWLNDDLLTSANLSLAVGFGFLSGWNSWASL